MLLYENEEAAELLSTLLRSSRELGVYLIIMLSFTLYYLFFGNIGNSLGTGIIFILLPFFGCLVSASTLYQVSHLTEYLDLSWRDCSFKSKLARIALIHMAAIYMALVYINAYIVIKGMN